MRHSALYIACLLANGSIFWATPGQTQLIPDQTLGAARSVVAPDSLIRGESADLIEGGAVRGANLFHSFSEFNVNPDQQVYFANPDTVESILSRITGSNPSDILGTLGVDGAADLFLINPNGIVFGPDASLDIEGSFYGTTATAVDVGEGVFSAVAPDQSQLLSVSPSTVFWNYLTNTSGDIVNRGQIAVNGELVLAGNNLDLEAQVAGAENVSLLATDTVKIRDTPEVPFIGFAGENLLVQGNERVDIVALSHPDSGLFSYGDMVLRSAAQVRGDAHYTSGGSFLIEDLTNQPGILFSPIDPIVRSLGDVTIGNYQGVSLHILAGGAVTIGTAEITAPEIPTTLGIDFLQETVTLTDGTVVAIDGSAQPTLDVRAGVDPSVVGVAPIALLTGLDNTTDSFTPAPIAAPTPTGSNITIGDVALRSPGGIVLLTNQYQPNIALTDGDITITGTGTLGFGIDARNTIDLGGSVFLDSRNNINVINSAIETSALGDVGDIILVADNLINFEGINPNTNQQSFARALLQPLVQGAGGDISITAENLNLLDGAQLIAETAGIGDAGNVLLNIRDTVRLEGNSPMGLGSLVVSFIAPGAQGNGGNVEVVAGNLEVSDGAQLSTQNSGQGDAGDVIVNIQNTARFIGINPSDNVSPSGIINPLTSTAQGSGGSIEITADNLELLDGALIDASTLGDGDAGDVTVTVRDNLRLSGVNPFTGASTQITSDIISDFQRSGGDVEIRAGNLEVLNGALIDTDIFENSSGTAGNITINVDGTARFSGFGPISNTPSGVSSNLRTNSQGQSGNIEINATNLQVLDDVQIGTSVFGQGNAGNVAFNITETALFDEANSSQGTIVSSGIERGGQGQGGNVAIIANNLQVLNGADISSSTLGQGNAGDIAVTAETLEVLNGGNFLASTLTEGNAGNITLNILGTARFDGAKPSRGDTSFLESSGVFSTVAPTAQGNGGTVEITAAGLEVLNGAQLVTTVLGEGDGGDLILTIRDTARFEGTRPDGLTSVASSGIQPGGRGDGGRLEVTATNLEVLGGAQLFSTTFGEGDAGDITLRIFDTARFDGSFQDNPSTVATSIAANAQGNSGNLGISATTLQVLDGAQINARSLGIGDAGNITLDIQGRLIARDGSITTESAFNAGGQINISSRSIALSGDSDITTFVGSGLNRGGNITIVADALTALDDSDILAFSIDGQGGDVDLSRTAFFGQQFEPAPPGTDPRTLDNNNRVDINATGQLSSGDIALLDISFIENSLTELPDNLVNTEALVASSCIDPTANNTDSFTIRNGQGIAQQPDDGQTTYSVGQVQAVSNSVSGIVTEPQNIYRLADGRLVMSRDCGG